MTITVDETINAAADATVDFASLPAGKTILVWGTKADSGGTALSLPATIDRVLFNLSPASVAGLNNQALVVGVDITPAGAPTAYAIANMFGAFSSGGFEFTGLEATDLQRLVDLANHSVQTQDVNTGGSTTVTMQVPGTWTEDEGFLFGMVQANASVGTVAPVTGLTIAAATSRVQFYRQLGLNDKNTKPSVTLTWANSVRWCAVLMLLKPASSSPPPGAPLSANLIFARAAIGAVADQADTMEGSVYVIEDLIDNYDAEPGALSSDALRVRYYDWRRSLAELREKADDVQAEIDLIQGGTTPPDQYKIVFDTTNPFVDPTTDMTNGVAFSANRWIGVRTIAGAVPVTVRTSWWLDRSFAQTPTQPEIETDGPDWSIAIQPTLMTNGTHTINAQIVTVGPDGEDTAVERHTFTFTTSGGAANTAPVVNAGVDQTVAPGTIIPALTMSATDAQDALDPTDAHWSQVSGPATLTPPPPANSPTWANVACITPGVYVVQASWSDPRGLVGTDSKTITVSAAGGAGGMAGERLGVFARTDYRGDGAGPRPTIPRTAADKKCSCGAPTFVESYWEADGLKATVIRELIGPQTWAGWRTNLTTYLPDYAPLCGTTPARTMLFCIPMFTGDEFTGSLESMRQAYARGAQGAYIQPGEWQHARDRLAENGYGIDFPVFIDPFSEFDLGNFPNVGQAGRLNFGRMRDGVACARRFYEYLKPDLPLIEFGTCRISSGGTPKYMNINNAVETFGGQFPQGLDMSQALLFEINRAAAPAASWWSWVAVNMYGPTHNADTETKWQETVAATTQYGIQTGSEEWGVSPDQIVTDNVTIQNYIDTMRDHFNALPASGPGSLKFNIYFEGLGNSCLYCNYPNALAHFKLTSVFGT